MQKTLIVCHGWGANPFVYKQFIQKAPSNWNIIVLDYQLFAKDKNLQTFNENLVTFLKENNLSKVYLLGHSMGGAIALQFAYNHPQFIQKLYLVDSEGIASSDHFLKPFTRIFFDAAPKYIADLRLALITFFKVVSHPRWHFTMGFYAHDVVLEEEAKRLKVPTTIFWGESSTVIPLWQGEKLHQLIKDSQLIIQPRQGHNWIVINPELFWNNI